MWNWNIFAKFPYGVIVAIAPNGLPVTHYSANSNSPINLYRHLTVKTIADFQKFIAPLELLSKQCDSGMVNFSLGFK
jgi:hypothetical protein